MSSKFLSPERDFSGGDCGNEAVTVSVVVVVVVTAARGFDVAGGMAVWTDARDKAVAGSATTSFGFSVVDVEVDLVEASLPATPSSEGAPFVEAVPPIDKDLSCVAWRIKSAKPDDFPSTLRVR